MTPAAAPRAVVVALLAVAIVAVDLRAQIPSASLSTIFPAGGRRGRSVEVQVGGSDLEAADHDSSGAASAGLIFSHPGIRARAKEAPDAAGGANVVPGTYIVEIAEDVPPGLYDVRIAGRYGVSNPRAFAVSSFDETVSSEPDGTIAEALLVPVGSAVHGRLQDGVDVDHVQFDGRRGQRIVIDCLAERLDSRLEAVITLFDSSGKEIASGHRGARTDPLIDFTAAADERYAVRIHDVLFRGGAEFFYRLSISDAASVAWVFPPSALPGSRGDFQVYGRNLPGGTPAPDASVDGRVLDVVTASIAAPDGDAAALAAQAFRGAGFAAARDAAVDAFDFRLDTPQGPTEPVPLCYAFAPVVAESEPNDAADTATHVAIPCEVVGSFHPRADRDWFSFDCEEGRTLSIEVFSHRLGLPTDPYVVVEMLTRDGDKESVREIQRADDMEGEPAVQVRPATSDCSLRFVAPGRARYRIRLADHNAGVRSDPRMVYRLVIRDEEPDFRLVALSQAADLETDLNQNRPRPSTLFLRRGGTARLEVLALRRGGFEGAIDVEAGELPAGVSCAAGRILAGRGATTLILEAAEDAPGWHGPIRVTGKARLRGEAETIREARSAAVTWPAVQDQGAAPVRLARAIYLAVSGEELEPIGISIAGDALSMSRGAKLAVPFRLVARTPRKGGLLVVPSGLPPEVDGAAVSIDEKTVEGQVNLDIKEGAKPGDFSFYLRGIGVVQYSRDAERARLLTSRVEELEKAKTALDAELAAAASARRQAEESAAAAAAELAAEEGSMNELSKEIETVALGMRTSDEPESAGLDRLRTSLSSFTSAVEKRAAARSRSQSADEARARSAEAAAALEARAALLAQQLESARKAAQEAQERAKPQELKIGVASRPAPLRVTAAPIAIAELPSPLRLAAGTRAELPVAIVRHHGFDGEVGLRVELPDTARGWKVEAAALPQAATKVSLWLEAAADAAAAQIDVELKATASFSGRNYEVAAPLRIEVAGAGAGGG